MILLFLVIPALCDVSLSVLLFLAVTNIFYSVVKFLLHQDPEYLPNNSTHNDQFYPGLYHSDSATCSQYCDWLQGWCCKDHSEGRNISVLAVPAPYRVCAVLWSMIGWIQPSPDNKFSTLAATECVCVQVPHSHQTDLSVYSGCSNLLLCSNNS